MGGADQVAAPPFELGHRGELDGLRAIAVGLVMGFHLTLATGGRFYGPPSGLLGVDIFFVLSGFLITALLIAEHRRDGHISLRAFWWRRITRILPALYAFLGGAAIVSVVLGESIGTTALSVGSALTNSTNWLVAVRGQGAAGFFLPLWSLSIEEQFYVLWPVLLALVWRRLPHLPVVAAGATAWVAIGLWRAYLVSAGHLDATYFRTDTRVDAVLAGGILAFALDRWGTPRTSWRGVVRVGGWAGLLGLAVLATQLTDTTGVVLIAFPGAAIATVAVILASLDETWAPGRVLRSRPMRWIGHRSYPLYLWHSLAFALTQMTMHRAPGVVFVPIAVSAALLAATVSNRWVETPVRHLRRAPNVESTSGAAARDLRPSPRRPPVLPSRPALRRALAASGAGAAGLLLVLVGPAFAARAGRADLEARGAASAPSNAAQSETTPTSDLRAPTTVPVATQGGSPAGGTDDPGRDDPDGTVDPHVPGSVLDVLDAVIAAETRALTVRVHLVTIDGAGLPDRSIDVEAWGRHCTVTTDTVGTGTCVVVPESPGAATSGVVIHVSFGGDATAAPSEDSYVVDSGEATGSTETSRSAPDPPVSAAGL